MSTPGIGARFTDAWLIDGVRTPFADYNGALANVSPTDLGIKAAREVFARSGVTPRGRRHRDHRQHGAGELRRLPAAAPYRALFRRADRGAGRRWCSGSAAPASRCIMQASDAVSLGRAELALCVGTESHEPQSDRRLYASRRLPARAGRVQGLPVGGAARPGRQRHAWATPRRISRASTRSPAPRWTPIAARSFERAVSAQKSGFLAGEIAPVKNETFELAGYQTARPQAQGREGACRRHPYPPLPGRGAGKIRPAFGGVQTGGNSSAIVDGAAAALVASVGLRARQSGKAPLARIVAGAAVGVPPEIMGIGPVPAIQAVLERAGLKLSDIDRFEINEAFGAQVMACARELGLDEDKLNVNGGAIAIGHPLGATGVRLADHAGARAEALGPALRHRLGLHRRRPGHRAADREPGRRPYQPTERTDHGHQGTRRDRHRRRLRARRRDRRACWPAPAPRSPASTSISTAPAQVADRSAASRSPATSPTPTRRPRRSRRRAPSTAPARILINCAGIGPAKRIVGRDGPMPLADFERVIKINLIGTFNMLRLVAADMQGVEPLADGERGVIISTASVAAFEGQIGQAAYASSKGGVVALTSCRRRASSPSSASA